MVTWPMTSRDPKKSRSWPYYLWAPYLHNGIVGNSEPEPDQNRTYLSGRKLVQYFLYGCVYLRVFKSIFDCSVVMLLFFASSVGTRRPLSSQLRSNDVVVTSLGRARLRAVVRLDTSNCQSLSALFPFDRIHCSVQLVLDSPATRMTRPAPNFSLIPSIDGRLKSWTICR